MPPTPPAAPSPPSDRAYQTLSEPAVNRSEQFARLLRLALVAPEPREAHRGAEFPGFGLLLTRNSERALEIASAFAASGSERFKRDFPGYAIDLGLPPLFLVVSIAVMASSTDRQASWNCVKFRISAC